MPSIYIYTYMFFFCVSYTFGEIIIQKSLKAPKLSALCGDNREMLHILTCFVGTRKLRRSCPSARLEGMWKTRCLSSCILKLGTRWRWGCQLHAPASLSPRNDKPWYPLNRRPGVPEISYLCWKSNHDSSIPWPSHCADWATPALIRIQSWS